MAGPGNSFEYIRGPLSDRLEGHSLGAEHLFRPALPRDTAPPERNRLRDDFLKQNTTFTFTLSPIFLMTPLSRHC